jgi:hypothetical protein
VRAEDGVSGSDAPQNNLDNIIQRTIYLQEESFI